MSADHRAARWILVASRRSPRITRWTSSSADGSGPGYGWARSPTPKSIRHSTVYGEWIWDDTTVGVASLRHGSGPDFTPYESVRLVGLDRRGAGSTAAIGIGAGYRFTTDNGVGSMTTGRGFPTTTGAPRGSTGAVAAATSVGRRRSPSFAITGVLAISRVIIATTIATRRSRKAVSSCATTVE